MNASPRTFDQYRDTLLWRSVAGAVADLVASGEIRVDTAPDYVTGYLCQELAAKWVVASSALTKER